MRVVEDVASADASLAIGVGGQSRGWNTSAGTPRWSCRGRAWHGDDLGGRVGVRLEPPGAGAAHPVRLLVEVGTGLEVDVLVGLLAGAAA